MASPPQLTALTVEAMGQIPAEQRKAFEELAKILNPYLNDSVNALDRNLTFGENFRGQVRDVEFVMPAITDTAYRAHYVKTANIAVAAGADTRIDCDTAVISGPVSNPTTTWRYQIQVPGDYEVRGSVYMASGVSAANRSISYRAAKFTAGGALLQEVYLHYRGNTTRPASALDDSNAGSGIFGACSAGEYIEFRVSSNLAFTLQGDARLTFQTVERAVPQNEASATLGSPFPLTVSLDRGFPGVPKYALVLSAFDVTASKPVAGVSVAFIPSASGISITDVKGCTPSRKYRLRLLILPE